MSFVHVEYFGIKPQHFQYPHSADTKDNFLLDTHFSVAAIQLVGDTTVF